jgi:hypothetical protein
MSFSYIYLYFIYMHVFQNAMYHSALNGFKFLMKNFIYILQLTSSAEHI